MTYAETIEQLANSLIQHFNEVYHSAELITIDNDKFPAVPSGSEWVDLSPTDQHEVLYIRRSGDEFAEERQISSCSKYYKISSPFRIVYFNDHSSDEAGALYKLLQSILIGGIKLRNITRDKFALRKSESSGDYNFGPDTVYIAVDVTASWDLMPDNCEQNFCSGLTNPLTRC